MKRIRLYPSEITILAMATATIALLLSRWPAIPEGAIGGGGYTAEDLRPVEQEFNLKHYYNETAEPWGWARAARDLARTYVVIGNKAEAVPLLKRCLAICEKYANPDKPHETIVTATALAELYEDTGRPAEALPLREQVMRLNQSFYGSEELYASDLVDLARNQRKLGRYTEAIAGLKEALKIKLPSAKWTRPAGWKPDILVIQWLTEYGEVLTESGKTADEAARIVRDETGQ